MRKADLAVLDEVLDKVAMATRRILELGPAAAMNEFNRKEDGDQGSGNKTEN
jgi:PTH1 family peptidyl-tRNA hydrolase